MAVGTPHSFKNETNRSAKMLISVAPAGLEGSWSGQHCITGKTFCTSAALLVLMTDRTQFPVDALNVSTKAPDKPAPKPDMPPASEKK